MKTAQAKPFWIDFFEIFGITDKRVATFELHVKKLGGAHGFVDLFWPGMLLVEQKSRGKNLDARLHSRRWTTFPALPSVTCRKSSSSATSRAFGVHRLTTNETVEFALKDLHKHIKLFGFVAGYKALEIKPQDPVNIKAAERMGQLHDALKASGYTGHPLEVLLVRLLFCLFADDTGIFQPAQAFRTFIEERTAADGSDLGSRLAQLFQVLNTPEDQAQQGAGRAGRRVPLRQRQAVCRSAAHGRLHRRHARGAAGRLRAGLVGHQPGHLRQPVPEHHGRARRGATWARTTRRRRTSSS